MKVKIINPTENSFTSRHLMEEFNVESDGIYFYILDGIYQGNYIPKSDCEIQPEPNISELKEQNPDDLKERLWTDEQMIDYAGDVGLTVKSCMINNKPIDMPDLVAECFVDYTENNKSKSTGFSESDMIELAEWINENIIKDKEGKLYIHDSRLNVDKRITSSELLNQFIQDKNK